MVLGCLEDTLFILMKAELAAGTSPRGELLLWGHGLSLKENAQELMQQGCLMALAVWL